MISRHLSVKMFELESWKDEAFKIELMHRIYYILMPDKSSKPQHGSGNTFHVKTVKGLYFVKPYNSVHTKKAIPYLIIPFALSIHTKGQLLKMIQQVKLLPCGF